MKYRKGTIRKSSFLLLEKRTTQKRCWKRSFLLLELLIAFSLILTIFFPLLRTHFALFQEERKQIEYLQLLNVKKRVFAHIREELYENRFHSFDVLKKGCEGIFPEKALLELSPGKIRQYTIKYIVHPVEYSYKKRSKERYLLIDIELIFIAQNRIKGSFTTPFLIEEHEKI